MAGFTARRQRPKQPAWGTQFFRQLLSTAAQTALQATAQSLAQDYVTKQRQARSAETAQTALGKRDEFKRAEEQRGALGGLLAVDPSQQAAFYADPERFLSTQTLGERKISKEGMVPPPLPAPGMARAGREVGRAMEGLTPEQKEILSYQGVPAAIASQPHILERIRLREELARRRQQEQHPRELEKIGGRGGQARRTARTKAELGGAKSVQEQEARYHQEKLRQEGGSLPVQLGVKEVKPFKPVSLELPPRRGVPGKKPQFVPGGEAVPPPPGVSPEEWRAFLEAAKKQGKTPKQALQDYYKFKGR